MLTESDILSALRDCYDPNLPCNIVDLGLVRSVSVAPDPDAPGAGIPGVPQKHRIRVEFSLTNATEEAEAQLSAQIRNRLAGIEEAGETAIICVKEPAWTPQQITPAGRRTLGLEWQSQPHPDPLGEYGFEINSIEGAADSSARPAQTRVGPIHPFDQVHATDTSGLVPASDLVTGHPNDEHVTAYYAVAPSILRSLVEPVEGDTPAHHIADYTFVDMGAGKGRAALLASEFPSARLLGSS